MKRTSAFTLIELLVVVAIIAILASLLLPALEKSKEQSKIAKCASNLRQLAIALNMYVDDAGGVIPSATPRCPDGAAPSYCPGGPNSYVATWLGTLYELHYCPNKEVMNCPSDPVRLAGSYHWPYTFEVTGYGYNGIGLVTYWYRPESGHPNLQTPYVRMAEVRNPAQTYWAADNADLPATGGYPGNYFYPDVPTWRHRNGLNILWVDGHVSWHTTDEAKLHHYYGYFYFGGNPDRWWDTL
jgi:prepilin-type N-terminal cleavage/methylation domain-containing protein/prepilin-type processing-associated H-X9-DG protein